jgi:hypothetical protein
MAHLLLSQGPGAGKRFSLEGPQIIVGRHPEAAVHLNLPDVSRRHAQITREQDQFFLEDLGSSNGTFLNGLPLKGKAALRDQDRIVIGPCKFLFENAPDPDRSLVIRAELLPARDSTDRFLQDPATTLQAVLGISYVLAQTLNLDELLPHVLDHLLRLFPKADRGIALLREGERIAVRAVRCRRAGSDTEQVYNRTVVQRVLAEGVGIVAADLGAAAGATPVAAGIRSFVCAPLKGRDGHALGVLQIDHSGGGGEFTPDDLHLLTAVSQQVAAVLENAALHAERDDLLRAVRRSEPVDAGEAIGPYRLLNKLGEGGMGVVFRATHMLLGKVVALKVLPAERLGDAKAVARFVREMKAVGCLRHPNIVQGTDAGEVGGRHFLVMELVEGLNLAELLNRRGPLPTAEACEVIRQAACGLQHAHEHGLVHRDLKPSNLMLTPAGEVKVLDLGLARLSAELAAEELTGTGQLLGTVGYMAPEQAFARYAVSIRADIYSLGCTLYKLLTGRTPYQGPAYDTPLKVLLAHANEPVPPIRAIRPEVEQGLAAVLDRALAKEPANRFATPAELAEGLRPFSAGAALPPLLPSPEPVTTDYSLPG